MPVPITVRIRNGRALDSQLRDLPPGLRRVMQDSMGRNLAHRLRASIRARTPVDTGALQASTSARPKADGTGWLVGWRIVYREGPRRPHLIQARVIEYGSRQGHRPRRVVRNAIARIVPEGQRRLVVDINRWLNSLSSSTGRGRRTPRRRLPGRPRRPLPGREL